MCAHRAIAAYIAATKPWHSSAADVATSESSHARGSGSPIGPCCLDGALAGVLNSKRPLAKCKQWQPAYVTSKTITMWYTLTIMYW